MTTLNHQLYKPVYSMTNLNLALYKPVYSIYNLNLELYKPVYSTTYTTYSESQINEYIARAHKMSSSKFILKYMTAVLLPHWSAQKESCLDVRSFKGLNTIYENIFKYHCS